MEDDLKKNKKMEDDLKTSSINQIGCDTIVNSPSSFYRDYVLKVGNANYGMERGRLGKLGSLGKL